MQNYLYNPCTAYCALSASDNSRVGATTLLYVTYWLCITNQYNHYKNNFAHLLKTSVLKDGGSPALPLEDPFEAEGSDGGGMPQDWKEQKL